MSLEHLDVLHDEMHELFQPRDQSPAWDDDLISQERYKQVEPGFKAPGNK